MVQNNFSLIPLRCNGSSPKDAFMFELGTEVQMYRTGVLSLSVTTAYTIIPSLYHDVLKHILPYDVLPFLSILNAGE